MDRYSISAIKAVRYIHEKKTVNPVEAWLMATSEEFGAGTTSQKKDCPKNAFLGLCEDGLILGIRPGKYISKENSLNKQYAINTVQLFKDDSNYLNQDNKTIWGMVNKGRNIKSNYQVQIVKALWEHNLIAQ